MGVWVWLVLLLVLVVLVVVGFLLVQARRRAGGVIATEGRRGRGGRS